MTAPGAPEAVIRAQFGPGARLEPLPGDASDRRYFRVHPPSGPTRVLAVFGSPFHPPYVPFERMAEFLSERGFRVPRVLSRHPEARALVLEDLGDVSLQAHLLGPAGADPGEWRSLYGEAVDLLVQIQRRGTPAVTPAIPAYHFALDAVKLARELEYFVEHYVRRLLGDPLAAAPVAAGTLSRSLERIAARAGRSGDRVLCHRDYHSRNLMLQAGGSAPGQRLAMIDFQDARLGPRAYDLASLLKDAYLDVPEEVVAEMTRRFLDGVGWAARQEEFAADFAWTAAQRTLKAVGTFAGQATRFGVARYLDGIPRALRHARGALASLPPAEAGPDIAALAELLQEALDYRAGPA